MRRYFIWVAVYAATAMISIWIGVLSLVFSTIVTDSTKAGLLYSFGVLLLLPTFISDWIFDYPESINDGHLYVFVLQFVYAFIIINLFRYLYALLAAVKVENKKENLQKSNITSDSDKVDIAHNDT